jgi:Zn-dependent protease
MTLQYVDIIFQIIAFLFAISVHESAHAWMANLRGDPTARMLGRITLNPIKHIDPIGTVLLPLIAAFTGFRLLGWAKPTPVNPRNFKNPVLDDVLTSVVGPVSNFVVATGATAVLVAIKVTSGAGRAAVNNPLHTQSALGPLCVLLFEFLEINVMLAVFNLVPIPPLDGSHVLRHFLPEPVRQVYDMLGIFGLMALIYFAPNLLNKLLTPVLAVFELILVRA